MKILLNYFFKTKQTFYEKLSLKERLLGEVKVEVEMEEQPKIEYFRKLEKVIVMTNERKYHIGYITGQEYIHKNDISPVFYFKDEETGIELCTSTTPMRYTDTMKDILDKLEYWEAWNLFAHTTSCEAKNEKQS
jgi:hypothetical protein